LAARFAFSNRLCAAGLRTVCVFAFLFLIPLALLGAPSVPRTLLLDVAVASDALVAVGERGGVYRSTDGGASWTKSQSGVHATLTAVAFADNGRTGWAVGHDAVILATADAGRSWRVVYRGESPDESFLDVCVLDQTTIIAVGAYGLYLESKDGGATWNSRRILDDDYHLNRITLADDGTLYLAGEHGTLLRSHDRGATWEGIHTPYDGSFYGTLPLPDGSLLAYGLRGRIYRSEDQGEDWIAVANDQRVLVACALRLRSGAIVLAGQSRAFFISHDDGRSFAAWAAPLTTGVSELVETADGTLLAFGETGVTRLPAPPAQP
jgi:photosystem II stability/assembly factor-like uncharacterized protein